MTAKIGSRLVTAMSSECCFSRDGGIRGTGSALAPPILPVQG